MHPVSRRDILKSLAIGCVAPSVLAACARQPAVATDLAPRAARRLGRVLVSPDRIIRQVVGLRPFRRSGFLVKAESFGDKTLIHNYGHGGGGISLSWGTSQLAAELAQATPYREAAVLGCGAVGLATARLLQDRGLTVTIYAKDLPPNTTSNIAGAQWDPVTVADADRRTPAWDAQYVAASRFAFRYYQTLVGPKYGISWRENYFLARTAGGPPSWESVLLADILKFVPVPPGEHPFGALNVTRCLSMHIEPSIYLAAVL
ncbi:MAG: FAD-dependent oxidoreductase, partial [Gemmatimonadales bacterium]